MARFLSIYLCIYLFIFFSQLSICCYCYCIYRLIKTNLHHLPEPWRSELSQMAVLCKNRSVGTSMVPHGIHPEQAIHPLFREFFSVRSKMNVILSFQMSVMWYMSNSLENSRPEKEIIFNFPCTLGLEIGTCRSCPFQSHLARLTPSCTVCTSIMEYVLFSPPSNLV